MQLLAGKVAIVTGASSGIGYAAAALFARHGAKVIAAARRSAELRQLVEAVTGEGGAARACTGDVRDEAFVQASGRYRDRRVRRPRCRLQQCGHRR